MAILIDTSAVVAAADVDDLNHRAVVAWLERVDEPLLTTTLTLAEVDHVLARALGPAASRAFVRTLIDGGIRLVTPNETDLARALELIDEAAGLDPRLPEAVLVAIAERAAVRRIATFDRRPIAIYRPRHVRAFHFEP